MLRAGSMTYTIFVAVITAILCSLMIVLAFMNRSFFIFNDRYEKAYDNALSGIALGMQLAENGNYERWHDLYSGDSDSVRLKRRPWGIYCVISSTAHKGGAVAEKAVLAGFHSEKMDRLALWLSDRNRPLHISGDALLKGDCALPEKGVERAYIEGKNYSRERMIYGQSTKSESSLPQAGNEIAPYWKKYFRREFTEQDSIISFEEAPLSAENSFGRHTRVFFSPAPVDLKGYSFEGNIIVISGSRITADRSSRLDNTVLIAPVIEIRNDFEGKVHLIASDSIGIARGVKMLYPSSVLMISTHQAVPKLLIEGPSKLNACLMNISESTIRNNNNPAIEVQAGSLINGWIYCNREIELSGKVNGSIICSNFLLTTPSGIYENHLLDGEINRELLPAGFAGFSIEGWENDMKPIEWVW